MVNLNDREQMVLVVLADEGDYSGWGFLGFERLMQETSLDRRHVRLACRSLARKGLTEFGRGLWTEDGEPAGSGYSATKAGRDFAKDLPRQCEDCGKNPADLPSRLCVGCGAYQEHQR